MSDIGKVYAEGFADGYDYCNIPSKYPPLGVAWLLSESGGLWLDNVVVKCWRAAKTNEMAYFKHLGIDSDE